MKIVSSRFVLSLALAFGTVPGWGQANLTPPTAQCGPAGCIDPAGESGQVPPRTSSTPVILSVPSESGRLSGDAGSAELNSDSSKTTRPTKAATPVRQDFEQFVEDSLGHPLALFARGLFDNPASTFSPLDRVPVPAGYVLGPGDELLVRAWGKIELDARVTVDRNGQIFLPRVGTIAVAGTRFDQIETLLHKAIGQQFKDFQLTVTLGQLRSMQIFVLGHARQPGVFTISSLSTLVNALFLSGGPSLTGTLRDIQVKRDGRVLTHFDVYRLLLDGDKSQDIPLLPGDILYIPSLGPEIAIDGNVNTPGIFELKTESTVGSALTGAGGLTSVAGSRRVVLEHISDHGVRHVEEFPLDAAGLARPVGNGDILRVFPISSKIENAVTLRGSVAQPGRYPWHEGMKVSDLIPDRAFLLTRSYFNGLNALDQPSMEHQFGLEVGKPAPPDIANHETEINWNYAVIQRLSPTDLKTELIPFALGAAISDPGSAENKVLQPGDVLVVYSRRDLPLPQQLEARFVRIDGEVMAAGLYRLSEGETLRDVVRRAGGFTPQSYLYAAQLDRESVRVEQQARLAQMIERIQAEVLSPANVSAGSANNPGAGAADLALRQAYLAKVAQVRPTGRIVLRLKPSDRTIADVPEFALQDGDHFFVPSIPNTVYVLGDVYNEGAMRFVASQHISQYVDAAGGPSREADRKREFIIRADGTTISRQAVSGFNRLPIYPGDSVIIPPSLQFRGITRQLGDWTQIVTNFALGALAIRALR